MGPGVRIRLAPPASLQTIGPSREIRVTREHRGEGRPFTSSGSGRAIRIGDAAVARDALASQGIANGISGGLSLFEGLDAVETYCWRTQAEILSHLSNL